MSRKYRLSNVIKSMYVHLKVKIWVVFVCMCTRIYGERGYLHICVLVHVQNIFIQRYASTHSMHLEGRGQLWVWLFYVLYTSLFVVSETRPFTSFRDLVTRRGWRAINSKLSACLHLFNTGSRTARPGLLTWILAMGLRASNSLLAELCQQAEVFILKDHLTIFVADMFYVKYM